MTRNSIGRGHLNENHARLAADISYAEDMAKALMDQGHPPPKVLPDLSHLSDDERQEYYFQMQPESTKKAILAQRNRKPEDDLEHLLRPIPQEYLANPEAKTIEELTGERPIPVRDYELHKSTQRSSRNTLGESKESSIPPEKRERAIHAFTYSRPADPSLKDLKRLKALSLIEAIIPEGGTSDVPKPKKSVWRRFWDWYGKSEENLQ